MKAARLRSVAFIKSGWLPAIKTLEKLTKYRDDLVSVYRRLGDAEEQVRRSQAGIIDSTVLQFTGMQSGLGV
jgi:hypothetical protein